MGKKEIIEKNEEQAPSFLMVLTSTGGAYQREDGEYVAYNFFIEARYSSCK